MFHKNLLRIFLNFFGISLFPSLLLVKVYIKEKWICGFKADMFWLCSEICRDSVSLSILLFISLRNRSSIKVFLGSF